MTAVRKRYAPAVRFAWELVSRASLAEVWEAVADTDRFNQTLGMFPEFEEIPVEGGGVRRVGVMRMMGMRLSWEEPPFQYQAPQWFRVRRDFTGGPMKALVSTVRLRALEDGVAIRYTVEFHPRYLFFYPLMAAVLPMMLRPNYDRTLKALVAHLNGDTSSFGPPPAPLSMEAEARLEQGLAKLSGRLALQLGVWLREAPEVGQDRMIPSRLARRWASDEDTVIRLLTAAAVEGILAVCWDVICPSCQGQVQRLSNLNELATTVHCAVCNIRFDGTFPDAVSVTFRPSPAIRTPQVRVGCIGGPSKQPSTVLREPLEAGGTTQLEVDLEPGPYRLRTWPGREQCALEVLDANTGRQAKLSVGFSSFQPVRVALRPGPCTLILHNLGDQDLDIVLERHFRPEELLTAGRFLQQESAVALLPQGALIPGFEAISFRRGVLAIEQLCGKATVLGRVAGDIGAAGALHTQLGDRKLVATFSSFEEALKSARPILYQEALRAAVGVGICVEVPLKTGSVVMGEAIDRTLEALTGGIRGMLSVPDPCLEDGEVQAAIAAAGASVEAMTLGTSAALPVSWLRFGLGLGRTDERVASVNQ